MPGTYLPAIWQALTSDRLQGYRVTAGEHDMDLLGRYVWNLELAESLYSSLNLLEVGLRNHLDRGISSLHGPGWLADALVLVKPDATAAVSAATAKLTTAAGPPSHGALVASLDFGFWTGLFDRAYEPGPPGPLHPAGQKTLWPSLVRPLFPGLRRQLLAGRFHELRRLRNRVFHHEPIWRGFPLVHHGVVGGHKGLDHQHEEMLQAIGWIDDDLRRTAVIIDEFPRVFAAGPKSYRALLELLDK